MVDTHILELRDAVNKGAISRDPNSGCQKSLRPTYHSHSINIFGILSSRHHTLLAYRAMEANLYPQEAHNTVAQSDNVNTLMEGPVSFE